RPAAALPGEVPFVVRYELADAAGGFAEFLFVAAGCRHRQRDGVGGVDEAGLGKAMERGSDAVRLRFDELRVSAERRELIDDQAGGACRGDVLDVLPASGVGGVG